MDISKITEAYGYDRRKFELPIKARSLTFHSSQEYPQLQIVDIVASAAAYYVNCLKRNDLEDYLFKELQRIKIDNYFKNMAIWPTTYVTPQELGTIYTGGRTLQMESLIIFSILVTGVLINMAALAAFLTMFIASTYLN
ncbi:hypothetical protein [Escherichia coli]|uniref:hypothetical protein n=1 Tax=Escherichia coli TaxID=562 RepID=UPI002026BEB8|nr:hypothetical protein [Escherichia coli]